MKTPLSINRQIGILVPPFPGQDNRRIELSLVGTAPDHFNVASVFLTNRVNHPDVPTGSQFDFGGIPVPIVSRNNDRIGDNLGLFRKFREIDWGCTTVPDGTSKVLRPDRIPAPLRRDRQVGHPESRLQGLRRDGDSSIAISDPPIQNGTGKVEGSFTVGSHHENVGNPAVLVEIVPENRQFSIRSGLNTGTVTIVPHVESTCLGQAHIVRREQSAPGGFPVTIDFNIVDTVVGRLNSAIAMILPGNPNAPLGIEGQTGISPPHPLSLIDRVSGNIGVIHNLRDTPLPFRRSGQVINDCGTIRIGREISRPTGQMERPGGIERHLRIGIPT